MFKKLFNGVVIISVIEIVLKIIDSVFGIVCGGIRCMVSDVDIA